MSDSGIGSAVRTPLAVTLRRARRGARRLVRERYVRADVPCGAHDCAQCHVIIAQRAQRAPRLRSAPPPAAPPLPLALAAPLLLPGAHCATSAG